MRGRPPQGPWCLQGWRPWCFGCGGSSWGWWVWKGGCLWCMVELYVCNNSRPCPAYPAATCASHPHPRLCFAVHQHVFPVCNNACGCCHQVVRLLGVAGHALLDSPALIVMAVMLQLCWVVVVLMPLMVGHPCTDLGGLANTATPGGTPLPARRGAPLPTCQPSWLPHCPVHCPIHCPIPCPTAQSPAPTLHARAGDTTHCACVWRRWAAWRRS